MFLGIRGKQKSNNRIGCCFWSGATGFEPAIFALTGQYVKPLHHAPLLDVGNNSIEMADTSRRILDLKGFWREDDRNDNKDS